MKLLPTLFKPLCTQQPKTSSFRIMTTKDDIYKTLNSVYFNPETDWVETPESWFTNSSSDDSGSSPWSSSMTMDYCEELVNHNNESQVEAIVRGAQQSSSSHHRLFFDPGESDSPRLQTPKLENELLMKKSVAMSVDSQHPYEDFKRSMEEMVESLGVRDDWEGLEELLRWYLKVNEKETHNYIINAFVDLVGDVIANGCFFGSQTTNNRHNCCSTSGNEDDDNDVDDHRKILKSTTSFSSAVSTLSSLGSSSSNVLDHMIY